MLNKLYDQLPSSDTRSLVTLLESALVSAAASHMSECIEQILVWNSDHPDMYTLEIEPVGATNTCTSALAFATIHGNVPIVKGFFAAGYKGESYSI